MTTYKKIVIHILLMGFLCFSGGCSGEKFSPTQPLENTAFPTETLENKVKTIEIYEAVAPTIAITPKLTPAPTITSTQLANSELLEVDEVILSHLPPDEYLVYMIQQNIYASSLDGKINKIIGQSRGQSIDSYLFEGSVFQVYDSENNMFVFYRLQNGKLEKIAAIKNKVGDSCWNNAISPDLHWQVMICGETERQIILRNLKSGKEEIINKGGPGTDNPVDILNPVWSPDGSWLVYFQADLASTQYENNSLEFIHFTCKVDNHDCTWEKVGPFIMGGEAAWGQYDVAWSPDSQEFAFILPGKDFSIEIFDIKSLGFRNIDISKYPATFLEWTPDARNLIISNPSGIYVYSLENSKITKLVSITEPNEIELVGWISTYKQPIFEVNEFLSVTTAGNGARIRNTPSLFGSIIYKLATNEVITILDGPIEADGYTWWKVSLQGSEIEGWVAENGEWYSSIR